MGIPAVILEGVGKRYRLGEHHGSGTNLREQMVRWGGRLLGRPAPVTHDLWSLRDVSLTVEEGQAIGIIGPNGAGKSTLLKIVSDITSPTEGRCRTHGRVGSLLEVGTGFHGALTGRENTFLNGAILGMKRNEIARRMDEIVEFAGIERFMDTPVRRYSSGMYLRLGFAIAAHLEADILIVDEVLAVGDAEFQRRCLGKMNELEESGRTVLFVSHNMDALVGMCPTAVWLDQGRIRRIGPADEVVGEYNRSVTLHGGTTDLADRFPDADARVTAISLVDEADRALSVMSTWSTGHIVIEIAVNEPYPGLDVAVVVINSSGTIVLDECLRDATFELADRMLPGAYQLRCPVPAILSPGDYSVTLWLGSAYESGERYEDVLTFRVDGFDARRRAVKLGLPWEVIPGQG